MAIRTVTDKFVHDLADIYDAEHRFLAAQQQMLSQVTAPQLRLMLQEHVVQTEQQLKNLERIYVQLGLPAQRIRSDAVASLVSEGQKVLQQTSDSLALRDCVIASAQTKAEHYELAAYRLLVDAAEGMGQSTILSLLMQNLQQEEQTAQMLNQIGPLLLQQAMNKRERELYHKPPAK